MNTMIIIFGIIAGTHITQITKNLNKVIIYGIKQMFRKISWATIIHWTCLWFNPVLSALP